MSYHNSADYDENADYRLALQISKELNGEQLPLKSAAETSEADLNSDADFAYALELQFGKTHQPYDGHLHTFDTNAGPSRRGAQRPEESPWVTEKGEAKVATYRPETEGGKTFGTLPEFLFHLRSAQCPKCGWIFFRSAADVSTLLQSWMIGKVTLSSILKCINCSTSSCISCTPQPFSNLSMLSVQGKSITWCCGGGRLLLLWLLHCGLDEHYTADKLKVTTTKPTQEVSKDRKSRKKAKQPVGGVGFGGPRGYTGSFMPGGMGYGSNMADLDDIMKDDFEGAWGPGYTLNGHHFAANATNTDGKAKALSAQDAADKFNTLILECLEGLYPSFERDSTFDFDPPEAVVDMLVHGKILSYCAELLRNDSLEDARLRNNLYHALLGFLCTLGAHHVTASRAIYGERALGPDKMNLLVQSFQTTAEEVKETGCSLFVALESLNTQSVLVLKQARSNEKEFQSQGGQDLLLICRGISDLHQYLEANSNASKDTKGATCQTKVPALADLPDDQVLAAHSYASDAKALQQNPRGRFKCLITGLTLLKTGLPPGIFVRYAESRPDVMKVAIIGPQGTPYENGIFEFDFFCNAGYPNVPPQVRFKTTGGGSVSFNPNLYPDGKVCLSLLGTWQGEPWVPGESTLLQVLISLQAMILCEEPWYNEPGREARYQRGSEKGPTVPYNQTIRKHTVRTAMLEWLQTTPPLWKDVVDQHFKDNANKILQTVLEWSKTAMPKEKQPRGYEDNFSVLELMAGQTGDLTTLLPRLQAALRKYGAKDVVPDAPQAVVPPPTPQPSRYAEPYVTMPPYTPSSYTPYQPVMNNPPQWISPFSATPPPPNPFLGHISGTTPSGSSGRGAANSVPNGRGGATAGGLGDGPGRYITRSSTRGRGGSLFGGDVPIGGLSGYGLRSLGGSPPNPGRGGLGRGLRGGRGERGGRGGQAGNL